MSDDNEEDPLPNIHPPSRLDDYNIGRALGSLHGKLDSLVSAFNEHRAITAKSLGRIDGRIDAATREAKTAHARLEARLGPLSAAHELRLSQKESWRKARNRVIKWASGAGALGLATAVANWAGDLAVWVKAHLPFGGG